MRIVRREFKGGKLDGRLLLLRDDLCEYKYEGETYSMINDVFHLRM